MAARERKIVLATKNVSESAEFLRSVWRQMLRDIFPDTTFLHLAFITGERALKHRLYPNARQPSQSTVPVCPLGSLCYLLIQHRLRF